MSTNDFPIPDFHAIGNSLKKDVRRYAKVYCLQWFDDSFQNQGFTDASLVKWDERNKPDYRPGGAILVNTTYLRKSIAVMQENDSEITFGTNAPYARLHNEGGRLRAVQYVRAHHRTRKGVREQVKAHARKVDIKYPKRQFMGHSHLMMQNLDTWLLKEIQKRFSNLHR